MDKPHSRLLRRQARASITKTRPKKKPTNHPETTAQFVKDYIKLPKRANEDKIWKAFD